MDWQSPWSFYAELFGWTKSEAYVMGAMDTYQTFSTNDEPMTGGMMTRGASAPAAM